ncbi:MAG TPA: hypothetical protein VGX37_07065 [Allosphingosinicella sp.]|jgi:hypothetical protein|nr:hypothetical protein [Allosphingosinicella sp.]
MTAARIWTIGILAVGLVLGGCNDTSESPSAKPAENGAGDTYGATGAPGADMTDNGAGDGANGLADTNQANGQ